MTKFVQLRLKPELYAKLKALAGRYPLTTWIRVQLEEIVDSNKES